MKSDPSEEAPGVDLISDVLPFGRLWYDTPDNAIGYARLANLIAVITAIKQQPFT